MISIDRLISEFDRALRAVAGVAQAARPSPAERLPENPIGDEQRAPIVHVMLSLSPFRRLVKDYFLVCESYYAAIKTQPASKIEAIDMGRRGIHDEGGHLLLERLRGKIEVDIATARRLFTLICVLHWKG